MGTKNYSDKTDRSGKINRPTAGNWDGRQHIGEGPWDGGSGLGGNQSGGPKSAPRSTDRAGSGGSGTAGIGGRAGPYRLDVGQELRMLSEEEKGALPADFYEEANKMADEAYAHRLSELALKGHDEAEYADLSASVAAQVAQLRTTLNAHEAREKERSWLGRQTQGDLDESRLVDGVAGAQDVYRRRGVDEGAAARLRPRTPKKIKFVVDCSGSMYTFNRIDGRLRRLQEVLVFLLEAFEGFEEKYSRRADAGLRRTRITSPRRRRDASSQGSSPRGAGAPPPTRRRRRYRGGVDISISARDEARLG